MKRLGILLIIAIVLLNVELSLGMYNIEVRKYMRQGIEYEKQRDYTSAILAYNKVLAIDERYIPAYYGRGVARLKIGNYEKSLSDLNIYLRSSVKKSERRILKIRYYIGLCNYHTKRYMEALKIFDEVLESNPDYITNLYNIRGLTNYRLGRYVKAIEDFTNYLAVNKSYAYAYLYRGRAYMSLGYKDEALRNYKEYVKLSRDYRSRRAMIAEIKRLESEPEQSEPEQENKDTQEKELQTEEEGAYKEEVGGEAVKEDVKEAVEIEEEIKEEIKEDIKEAEKGNVDKAVEAEAVGGKKVEELK